MRAIYTLQVNRGPMTKFIIFGLMY